MRRTLSFVLVMLVAHRASADSRTEMGLSATTSANAGLLGLNAGMLGGDVFVGRRIAPRVTLQGSFVYAFENGRWKEPLQGAPCSGSETHRWTWEGFAARVWIDTIHTSRVRLSLAPPSITVGLLGDDAEFGGGTCSHPPASLRTWLLAVGLGGISLDVVLTRSLEVRAWTEAALVLDGEPVWFNGGISISASIGPTFRF